MHLRNSPEGTYNRIVTMISFEFKCRFVPSKFENIFIKHAHTHANALTAEEVDEMLKENREPKDYNGWLAH